MPAAGVAWLLIDLTSESKILVKSSKTSVNSYLKYEQNTLDIAYLSITNLPPHPSKKNEQNSNQ
jgi:hypothetical protein